MNPSPPSSNTTNAYPTGNFFERTIPSPLATPFPKNIMNSQNNSNDFFFSPPQQPLHGNASGQFSKSNFIPPSFDFQSLQPQFSNVSQNNLNTIEKDQVIEKLMAENAKLKSDLAQISLSNQQFTQALFGSDPNSNIGTIITVENATLVAWNQNVRQMLGYDESDLFRTVKTWRDLIHASDLGNVLNTLLSAVAHRRESFYVSYKAKCKDGSLVPVKTNNFLGYDQKTGKPLYTICFVTLDSDNSNAIFAGRPFSLQQQLQQQQLFLQRVQQTGGTGPVNMGKMPSPQSQSPFNRSPPNMQENNQPSYFSQNPTTANPSNTMFNPVQRNVQ